MRRARANMRGMKTEAAVSRSPKTPPRIETVDVDGPHAHEVLVRMVASGVCHTDLWFHADLEGGPMVLGHEGAGIVERVGDGVEGIKKGDHVVLAADWCGHCPMCRKNQTSYCYEGMARNFGGHRPDGSSPYSKAGKPIRARFFGQSSFSRMAIVAEHSCVVVPRDVPLDVVAPMGCGVITGAGGIMNGLKVGRGDSIAIFGVGGVGLSALMAARIVGALTIIAIDVQPARLKLAKDLGATHTIDAKKKDVVNAIHEICPFGVNFSYNTTESPKVYTQALDCLAMKGVAGLVTMPDGDWHPDVGTILGGGRALRGLIGGDAVPQQFIPELIQYWKQGRLPLERMIERYAFERIADAFRDSGKKTIKPVLLFEK